MTQIHFKKMKELIEEYNERIKNSLQTISENCKEHCFQFNTGELVPFTGKDSEKNCPAWQRLWRPFKQISSPVVYWFQLTSDTNPADVFEAAKKCKEAQVADETFRYLPALKKNGGTTSKTLYVGCCASTKFDARMFWHFGYYKVGQTQGLQLCHWSRPLAADISIHVLQLPPEAKDLVYVYEKLVAQKLTPIIGK